MKKTLISEPIKDRILLKFCMIFAFCLINICTFGQVSYRVGLDADKVTYRVFMKSTVAYASIQAKISTAQVTLIVPHGVSANQFQISNLQGKTVGNNTMIWGITRVDAPFENVAADYISFGYTGSGSPILFDIGAGTEIELFNFKNTGNCLGSVALFATGDPFSSPNKANTNPGNQITILGFGANNAYQSNYGGNVTCQTATNAPDLSANITGAANVSPSTATNYTINIQNIGNSATSGSIITNTTLPVGVAYNATSGNGWSSVATPQSNGTTLVSSTYNQIIAANGSAIPLILTVTPSNTLPAGSIFPIVGSVAGGGETNVSNNSFTKNITILVNTTDLGVSVAIDNKAPSIGSTVNYTFEIKNNGTVNASNVQNQIVLPAGFALSNVIAPVGTSFNQNTGIWTINTITTAQSFQLNIAGKPSGEGVYYATINIISSNISDNNAANNSDVTCYGIPVSLCSGASFIARIAKNNANIQWFKNGTPISGATKDTLVINTAGSYSFTSSIACPTSGCCPLVVVAGTSSALTISPSTVSYCGNYNLTNLAVSLNGNAVSSNLGYYPSQADALAGTNQIGNLITQSGKYWLRYKPSNGCASIGSVDVVISNSLTFTQPNPVCASTFDLSTIELFNNGVKVTSGIIYYGVFSNSLSSVVVFPLNSPIVTESGQYYAAVKDANNCTSLAKIQVQLTGPKTPNVQDATNNCPTTTVNLLSLQPSPSTTGGVFEWHASNSATSPLLTNTSAVGAGTYYIFEKSVGGCISNGAAVKISIKDCCQTADCSPFRMVKVRLN